MLNIMSETPQSLFAELNQDLYTHEVSGFCKATQLKKWNSTRHLKIHAPNPFSLRAHFQVGQAEKSLNCAATRSIQKSLGPVTGCFAKWGWHKAQPYMHCKPHFLPQSTFSKFLVIYMYLKNFPYYESEGQWDGSVAKSANLSLIT